MGSEWIAEAPEGDFEWDDDMWEYVGRDPEHDWMNEEYDRLCEVLEFSQRNRQLRRDQRVVAAHSALESVVQRLYIYGNGYSEYDYDRLNVSEWDELYPLADACFVALAVALTEVDALANHLLDLADESISSPRVSELLPAEPTAHPPSVRSEPALAHAPPLSRVALFSDDVMAAA